MAYVLVKKILYSDQELVQISLEEIKRKGVNTHAAVSRGSWRLKERRVNMVPRRPRVKHCPQKLIPNSGRIPARCCQSHPACTRVSLPPLSRAAAIIQSKTNCGHWIKHGNFILSICLANRRKLYAKGRYRDNLLFL